jgi:general secretion pathway protein D
MFLTCAGNAQAGPTVLEVTPSSLTTSSSTFSLDIAVTGVSDLYAFQFDLGFDPTILAATSVTEGTFLPGGGATLFIPGAIDNVGGTISSTADTLQGAIPGVSGSGDLAVINFEVLGPGTSTINIFNAQMLDSNLNGLLFTTNNGSVTVSQVAAAPEPGSVTLLSLGLTGFFLVRRRHSYRQTRRSQK